MNVSIKRCEDCGSTKLKWFYDDKFKQWYLQCENCGEQYVDVGGKVDGNAQPVEN